jgi:DNA-binding SARP family transcriptional activator
MAEAMIRHVVPSPAHVVVRLLGRIEAEINGRQVRLGGRHAQALLALLALSPRPRTREALALDLWPEASSGTTAALRQALWLVRSALCSVGIAPEAVLECDAETVSLRSAAGLDLDVVTFDALMTGPCQRPAEAISLYRGELAEGLCHECFAAERERLAARYEDALALYAAERLAVGDLETARSTAGRLVARDPLREEAHAVLLEVLGATGSRSQVFRHYQRLRDVLRRELNENPLPETEAAYRRAIAATIDRSARRVAGAVFARPAQTVISAPS